MDKPITYEQISQLLDSKLEPIKNDISAIKTDVHGIKQRLGNVETHLDSINTRLYKLEERVNGKGKTAYGYKWEYVEK